MNHCLLIEKPCKWHTECIDTNSSHICKCAENYQKVGVDPTQEGNELCIHSVPLNSKMCSENLCAPSAVCTEYDDGSNTLIDCNCPSGSWTRNPFDQRGEGCKYTSPSDGILIAALLKLPIPFLETLDAKYGVTEEKLQAKKEIMQLIEKIFSGNRELNTSFWGSKLTKFG